MTVNGNVSRIKRIEVWQQGFQVCGEIWVVPQIVKKVLPVRDDGRGRAQMQKDLTDSGPPQSAVGESSDGALQSQVTHALGV